MPPRSTSWSLTGLRCLRAVAEHGSFSAAASVVSLTQSAVSRQIATLEADVGQPLFERRRDGVRLTDAGRVLLRHAGAALDTLEEAARELGAPAAPPPLVRLGAFPSAGAALIPRAAALLRARGSVELVTTEGSTRSLVRALRSGALDLAVVATSPPFRPLDEEQPPLVTVGLTDAELLVALPARHPLAAGDAVTLADLEGQRWVATRSRPGEPMLGVWPGLGGRPQVVHHASDWLTKLQLVATGAGLTTVTSLLLPVLPAGVRALPVIGGSQERRRTLIARLPSAVGPELEAVVASLTDAAA
jgi:DNA-binding transcriptional LysR family regulator